VGAIYAYDQTAEAWAALNDAAIKTAQFDPALSGAISAALGLPPKTVSAGKIVTALKRIGFTRVFDVNLSVSKILASEYSELQNRIKNGGKLPLIIGCSPGVTKFVENCYSDLKDHLFTNGDLLLTDTVTVMPCIAHKLRLSGKSKTDGVNLALTAGELARMFNLAGIVFDSLPESPFDAIGEFPAPVDIPADYGEKTLIVNGFAAARTVLDSIRKGKCDAFMVKILSCPSPQKYAGCPFGRYTNFQVNMIH
jgi:iron only hydrogenase large subunit-like protein